MSAPADLLAPPSVLEFLADAQQRLDDLLPSLRPGTVAYELHRITAAQNAALRLLAREGAPR